MDIRIENSINRDFLNGFFEKFDLGLVKEHRFCTRRQERKRG